MNKQRTTVKVLKPKNLSPEQVSQIVQIYLKHHNISQEKCMDRVKNGFDKIVLLQKAENKEVVGFFGVRLTFFKRQSFFRPVLSLYMGQLYVEKAYRHHYPVHAGVIKLLGKYKVLCPWLKVVIWGDALTFKPYLLIAQNFPEFYPHPEKETPEAFREIFSYLGTKNYGDQYDIETGCVTKTSKLIKEHVAPIPPRLLKHKFIGFYAEQNKEYKKGHGLLVMGHFSFKAFIAISKKANEISKGPKRDKTFSLRYKNPSAIISQQQAG